MNSTHCDVTDNHYFRVQILANQGAAEIDHRLEEQLIDGILYAFQEQTTEDVVMLNGFGTVVNTLERRVKAYLPQVNIVKYSVSSS